MYEYSVPQWLMIFYIYCFLGWMFESCVVSVQQKRPVNRGFLRGPMLPIYGFGAGIMLHVSLPLEGHPVRIFLAGMVAATAFEYVVGVAMEAIFKVKYWDYSEHRFQFQGRICLQSSLAWGALSVLLVYALHPPVEYLVKQFTMLPLLFTTIVLSVYFVTDVVASVKTALDFAKLLEELDQKRADIMAMRDQFAAAAWQKKAEISAAAQEQYDRLADAAQDKRERLTATAENARLQMYLAIQDAEDQLNDAIRNMKRTRKSLVRGNPTLRSDKFDETLREIKERLGRKK